MARYIRARHGWRRALAKAALVGAVPPIMVKSGKNYGRDAHEAFDGMRAALLANRAQFFRDLPSGIFYGCAGREGVAGRDRQLVAPGHDGWCEGPLRLHRGLSETDFTEDLKAIAVPVLMIRGDDDQIVPIADSALLSARSS